jgi:hypothetical protein
MLNIVMNVLSVTMKKIEVVVSTLLTSPTMIFIVNLQMPTIVIPNSQNSTTSSESILTRLFIGVKNVIFQTGVHSKDEQKYQF